MLEAEGRIQEACNEVGMRASAEALKRFDTDGSPIVLGAIKWTKRCASPKVYQTPYGAVEVERNVYQTSQGGRIYCPLEAAARIIRHATPRLPSSSPHKYAQMNVNAVCAWICARTMVADRGLLCPECRRLGRWHCRGQGGALGVCAAGVRCGRGHGRHQPRRGDARR